MSTTLLAVTGLSPAIVTETLWALGQRETILPERVVFITTATGAVVLEEQLFDARDDWDGASVWESLRRALAAGPHQLIAEAPKVICRPDPGSGRALPLDDIRTRIDNDAAAEFIFSQVWEVVRDKDRRLHASIAGGRKTMGALLHAAVSLIGREQDRISHVLVSPPYDSLPGFYFPGQSACPIHHPASGRSYLASDAQISLADMPFVPLRNRFQDLDDLPASFLALRQRWSDQLRTDAERPVPIRIDHQRERIEVEGREFQVRPRALAVLHFILKCNERDAVPPDQATAAEAYCKAIAHDPSKFGQPGIHELGPEDFRRELNHLRSILRSAGWQPAVRTLRQAPFRLEIARS